MTALTRRRALFSGAAVGGALALPAAAISMAHPDADLLAACAEFYRTQAELDAWYESGFGEEPYPTETAARQIWQEKNDRLFFANAEVFQALIEMPAKSLAGIGAKSKVLTVHMNRVVADLNDSMDHAEDHEVFAYKLAQNIMLVSGGAS